MGLLALVGAAAYAFEMASPDLFPLFYKVSIQLGVFFSSGSSSSTFASPRPSAAVPRSGGGRATTRKA